MATIKTKEELLKLNEEDFRNLVLIPILHALGYSDILHSHGSIEYGKDIVCAKPGEFGETVVTAFVVKAGKLSGPKECSEVARQARQALRNETRTGTDNTLRRAQNVRIASNGSIPKTSREQVLSELEEWEKGQIRFIDADLIWMMYCSHFPVDLAEVRKTLQQAVAKHSDDAIEVSETISPGKSEVIVRVKDSNKLTPEHVAGSVTFNIPNTEEGRELAVRIESLPHSNEPLTLTSDQAQIRFPLVLERLLADHYNLKPGDFTNITISPAEPREPIRVSVILDCDDGDSSNLQYLELRPVRSAPGIVRLSNETQDFPIKLSITLDAESKKGSYHFELVSDEINASLTVIWLDFKRCLEKPGRITLTNLSTGIPLPALINTPSGLSPEDTSESREFFSKIARIERRLGRPIVIPEEVPDPSDQKSLSLLTRLAESPVYETTWKAGTMELEYVEGDEGSEFLLSGDPFTARLVDARTIQLLGGTIELGPFERIFHSAVIEDHESVRQEYDRAKVTGESVMVRIVPCANNKVTETYLDFVDRSTALNLDEPNEPR